LILSKKNYRVSREVSGPVAAGQATPVRRESPQEALEREFSLPTPTETKDPKGVVTFMVLGSYHLTLENNRKIAVRGTVECPYYQTSDKEVIAKMDSLGFKREEN
jgi:hypothetical protein